MTVEEAKRLSCGRCGQPFLLSARNARGYARRGEQPVCHNCRVPSRLEPNLAAKYGGYWLERFTVDEIRQLAEGIWGTPAR